MKNYDPNLHLTYDELLRTMTDVSDLDPDRQAHFEACHRCRRQAEDLACRYHRLGQMARTMAPEPSRAFRVPTRHTPTRWWNFKPGMALGVLGVLIFVFTVWWPRPSDYVEVPVHMVAESFEDDEQLMARIDALVDDALPKAYQRVAVASEPVLSKDLIDWIVPSIDEDG
jgi:hypothetical protein